MRGRVKVAEGREVTGQTMRDFTATVRTSALGLSRWEPWKVLSRGERGPDLGLHCIPLAACGEWTGSGENGGGEKSLTSGDLQFEGEAIEFADVQDAGCEKFRSSCENSLDVIDGNQVKTENISCWATKALCRLLACSLSSPPGLPPMFCIFHYDFPLFMFLCPFPN